VKLNASEPSSSRIVESKGGTIGGILSTMFLAALMKNSLNLSAIIEGFS
jgi:hypothetical protein